MFLFTFLKFKDTPFCLVILFFDWLFDFAWFVFLTVYKVFVFVVTTNEIKVTFTEHVPLLYVAKCWLNRGHLSLKQQYSNQTSVE